MLNFNSDQSDHCGDANDLLDKIVQVVEISVANLVSSDDIDLFYICLLRLLNISISFALRVKYCPKRTNDLFLLWNQLQSSSSNKSLLNESLNLFPALIPNDSNGIFTNFVFKHIVFVTDRRNEFSIEALVSAFEKLNELVLKYPVEACEVIVSLLFHDIF